MFRQNILKIVYFSLKCTLIKDVKKCIVLYVVCCRDNVRHLTLVSSNKKVEISNMVYLDEGEILSYTEKAT
jgi:hypothetical protein